MNRQCQMHPMCTQKPGRLDWVFICVQTNTLILQKQNESKYHLIEGFLT